MKEKCKIICMSIICIIGLSLLISNPRHNYMLGSLVFGFALSELIDMREEAFERKVQLVKYHNLNWLPPREQKYEHPYDYEHWRLCKFVLFVACFILTLIVTTIIMLGF